MIWKIHKAYFSKLSPYYRVIFVQMCKRFDEWDDIKYTWNKYFFAYFLWQIQLQQLQ